MLEATYLELSLERDITNLANVTHEDVVGTHRPTVGLLVAYGDSIRCIPHEFKFRLIQLDGDT